MSSERPKPPEPIVKSPKIVSRGVITPKLRKGRGFSVGELKEVGLSVKEARKLGLYVDERRRSVHPENVEALRRWLEELKASGQPKR